MTTKESDDIFFITTAMAHDYMLFFSNQGRVFKTRVWEIPLGARTSKGKAIVNLLTLRPNEVITSVLSFNEELSQKKGTNILMVTKKGLIKKTEFNKIKSSLDEKGSSLIPLEVRAGKYIKVLLGFGRGRKRYDKRQRIRERETERKLREGYDA